MSAIFTINDDQELIINSNLLKFNYKILMVLFLLNKNYVCQSVRDMRVFNLMTAVLIMLFSTAINADEANKDASGLRKMAQSYEHGHGVKKSYDQALELYCKAALMGDALSAYNRGFMYFIGRGVARDLPLAIYWFKKSAGSGDIYAKRMLLKFRSVAPKKDESCQPDPLVEAAADPVIKVKLVDNPKRDKVIAWVNQIAPHYGIDPQLVMAVIQAESAFNTQALSNKNAQGLMQLIPATAERFGVKDSWNPVQNIKGGTAYLHWLMRHFAGNVEHVLAAYNAGEGAVERYQGIPPYQETQNYVKRILSNYPKKSHPIPPEHPEKFDLAKLNTLQVSNL